MPTPLVWGGFCVGCALPLVRGCIRLREELCTPGYCIAPNPHWRFLCVGSPVWTSGNPSVWRRGRRAVVRTSKHIRMLAIDPFSLTLSLLLCALHHFILLIHIIWLACLCVPHLCLTTRASYSASTLIQRNQEELVQNPSPGIRLHSLVTLSVLLFSF